MAIIIGAFTPLLYKGRIPPSDRVGTTRSTYPEERDRTRQCPSAGDASVQEERETPRTIRQGEGGEHHFPEKEVNSIEEERRVTGTEGGWRTWGEASQGVPCPKEEEEILVKGTRHEGRQAGRQLNARRGSSLGLW